MPEPLIVTGFYANAANYHERVTFMETWLKNTGPREIVIVDNADLPLPSSPEAANIRIVRINNNMGHADSFVGKFRPHLLGMSACWLIGAMIAYSENRDLIYKEQDCLAFGEWEHEILSRASFYKLNAAIGYGLEAPEHMECCLFWVRHVYLTEFVTKYMSQPEGDGQVTPEEKFGRIQRMDNRVGHLHFGVGRDRPLPWDDKAWYGQRFTDMELGILKYKGLI